MTRLLSIPLAFVLAMPVGSAWAEEPAEEPTVSLEVDLEALPPGEYTTEYIATHLPEHQARVLADGGITVVDDAENTIRVSVSRYGEGDIHYRFTVALFEGGSEAPIAERTLSCELCRESDLFTKVGEEVARMSGRLLYGSSEEPEPEGAQVEEHGEPEQTEPKPKVRRIGGTGWAGIAVAAVGVAVGVGGVVDLRRPPERVVDPQAGRTIRVTRHRTLGTTLVGVGVGALVAGAVLVAVDQTVLLERRRQRAKQVSIVPSVSPTSVGMQWSIRF